jgi:hypothetical protein
MKNPNRLRAADLKKRFSVFGHFYQISLGGESVGCRSLLELVSQDTMPVDPNELAHSKPDLLVIMMNPGSSRPLDGTYQPPAVTHHLEIPKSREWVATQPDNTQYQIMRIMAARGYNHGRVLNLSDIREPKSPVLFKKMSALESIPGGRVHSLFSSERHAEFEELLESCHDGVAVLVGWGRDKALIPLATVAKKRLAGKTLFGQPVDEEGILYAHPSPMLQRMKEAWVDGVLVQIP